MITELHLPAIRVEAELGARVAITLSTLARLKRQRPSEVAAEIITTWLQEHGEAAVLDASLLQEKRQRTELLEMEKTMLARRTGRPRKPTASR